MANLYRTWGIPEYLRIREELRNASIGPGYSIRLLERLSMVTYKIRPVRRACTPLGAVATCMAVLAAACLAGLAAFPRRPRTGTACPGLLDRAKREGEYVP